MAAEALEGGCLCGAVRYRIAGPVLHASRCHCATCRRAAGAEAVAWATVARADFAWTRGAPRRHASSAGVARGHCAACGTSLSYLSQDEPETIDVTLASLDAPERVPPTRETWLEARLPWTPRDAALPGSTQG
jgi:hypothetical protein